MLNTDPATEKTFSFTTSKEESEYINTVCAARCKAGLSANMNDFLRQAINFALNFDHGWKFGSPNIKKVHFKKQKE